MAPKKYRGAFPPESWHDENLTDNDKMPAEPAPTPLQRDLHMQEIRSTARGISREQGKRERLRGGVTIFLVIHYDESGILEIISAHLFRSTAERSADARGKRYEVEEIRLEN